MQGFPETWKLFQGFLQGKGLRKAALSYTGSVQIILLTCFLMPHYCATEQPPKSPTLSVGSTIDGCTDSSSLWCGRAFLFATKDPLADHEVIGFNKFWTSLIMSCVRFEVLTVPHSRRPHWIVACMLLFLKLWSTDHRWSTAVSQVVHGGPQAVSEEKALQKLFQTRNESKIPSYKSVLKLPL
jgi:hypothetical protein